MTNNTKYELMSEEYDVLSCADSLTALVADRALQNQQVYLVRKSVCVDQTKLLLDSVLACQRYNLTLAGSLLDRHYQTLVEVARARPPQLKWFVEYMLVTRTPKKIEITPTSQLQQYMLSFETFKGKRKVAPKKTTYQAVITEDTAHDRILQTRKAAAFDMCGSISFDVTSAELAEFERSEIFSPRFDTFCFLITNLVGTSHHANSYLDEVFAKVSRKRNRAIKKIVGRLAFFFGQYAHVAPSALLYSQLVIWFEPEGLNCPQLSQPTA